MSTVYKTTVENLYSVVPFLGKLSKNHIIWREGHKGGINMGNLEEKQLQWFGHEEK
jgi:hypothetical protein